MDATIVNFGKRLLFIYSLTNHFGFLQFYKYRRHYLTYKEL